MYTVSHSLFGVQTVYLICTVGKYNMAPGWTMWNGCGEGGRTREMWEGERRRENREIKRVVGEWKWWRRLEDAIYTYTAHSVAK